MIRNLGMAISENPLFETARYHDVKDPCPVWDGQQWHLYGSGGSSEVEMWNIFHATAPSLDGPWIEQQPAYLEGLQGDHVAAPAVIYNPDTKLFNMFVQTDFMALGGTIERLVSADGQFFEHTNTLLKSLPGTAEAGIYDPDPAVIAGQKYITYSGTAVVGQPDIYLARSTNNTWKGPWERLGVILRHEDIEHHNQRGEQDYEWGLEGSQIVELPDGKVLLNAVCFLPSGTRGTRQRIFFAVSDNGVLGPYKSLGPILTPTQSGWASGENGHGSVLVDGEELHLFYQARPSYSNSSNPGWRYGRVSFSLGEIKEMLA
ncbi:MAG: hypothetical protein OHK0017_10350 [Patescibacteria group bacterium]